MPGLFSVRYFRQLLLMLLFLMPVHQATAASDIPEKKWQEITSQPAFKYKDKLEVQPPPKNKTSDNPLATMLGWIFAFFATTMGKAILWTILFGLIALVLFKIFSGNLSGLFHSRSKIVEQEAETPTELPEDIMGTNWEQRLQQAADAGNMRLAIRYSYLLVLQLLQQQQLINYRTDKTNYDYYAELSNASVKKTFRLLTNQYEYAWYGNYAIQPEAYEVFRNDFRSLTHQLAAI